MSNAPPPGLDTCFSAISSIQSTTYSQLQDYAASWNTFRSVELYNSNISTQRGNGNKSLNYYQFFSQTEKAAYNTGAVLFFTYLQYSTIVEKN
jgi:hypothetical protein